MSRSRHSQGPQWAGDRVSRRGLLTAFRLVLLAFALFAPLRSSLSAPISGETAGSSQMSIDLTPSLISELNGTLTTLWPQLVRKGEAVELSEVKAAELVDAALSRLRASGRTVPRSLRTLTMWHLTSCFSLDGGALRGINGMFGAASKILCPNGSTFSCVLAALGIPASVEEQNETQQLEASVLAAAFRHIGHDAAANAASSRGTGLGPEAVRQLAVEETRISSTDPETQALFVEGARSQLDLQKGFRGLQWVRFGRFHRLSSAFSLAQRLFYKPDEAESSSEGAGETPMQGSMGEVVELVFCVARNACLGINEPGFQRTVDKCIGLVGKSKKLSPLDLFFRSTTTRKQSSLAAQVFGTAILVLHSVETARLGASEGADTQGVLQQSVPLSPLQQAVANSVATCSTEVMNSLESHLQALGGLEAISVNPVLFASIAIENAPLLFALNGVPQPESLSSELLLQQHVHALAYFVEKPDILPEGPQLSDALQEFTSSASKLSETLRAAAAVANGALDLSAPSSPTTIRLLDALQNFERQIDDNLLPVGMSFLEDGDFSLYGPAIHERIVSTTEETCSATPPAGDRSAFKSFVIMQRLEGHLEQITGNETLQRVYMGTANKTGLSARAVESTFVRTQARQLFIFIQSLLDNPSEEIQKRFSTTEGLQAYITEYLAGKVGPREQPLEEAGFGATKYSGETIALANAVLKELQRTFAKLIASSASFQKAQRTAGMSVRRWIREEFSDFRGEIHASYLIDAAYGCLQQCTGPLLADKRLQTQCTGSQGGPQPLGKCADPAEQFQRIVSKELWERFLVDWLKQGKAATACSELVELEEEDSQAWQRQVYLMVSHLDTIGCGKDHRGFDSFGRYSIKLEMIQHLYDMFASTAQRPTLENFINWLVKLREPLPQDLQTPTALALQYAGGHPQTQVRVSKAFNMAVKGDPFYSQCKAEDTKIISELIGSLGSVFYTLEAFEDFIKERRSQEETVTRQVTAPLAAKARPILNQLMVTYSSTGNSYPEAIIRYPSYFSSSAAAAIPQLGMEAMRVLVYMNDVLGNLSAAQFSVPERLEHFFEAVFATKAWTVESLQTCDRTCSLRSEGEAGVFITLSGGRVIPIPAERISIKKVHKKIDVVKTENKNAEEPEEMITVIPPKPEVSPKLEKSEDACMQVVRLYEKYIEGSAIKDVLTLYESAMKVPLFASTRSELGLKEDETSLQKFRLTLCVMCAKEIEGGTPLASPTRHHKMCSQITAALAAIFSSASRAGGKRVPPSTMAGGLRNWLAQEGGLRAWAEAAHKKLKSDKSVAALCAALRYAEYMRQITKPGIAFDRMLSHWNLTFPLNSLSLVNALRSASNPKQKLTQELCVVTPPGQEVQQLPRRFDAAQWAALMLQTGQEGAASAAGM
ncbi:uncharacterized protein EMH_0041910 [Eimeria mitis]|uniref:Uncharacterized protein n=1 Tax=Eimeria mitis TaxID=44415 RepID=U6K528_9EIME|nr:uncharacterized protein EMH_0041910 [Eimeria mitis]CDJ32101.1 hypothetical protein, conserved [Eimeria mitis]